jgi:hypothetical protein
VISRIGFIEVLRAYDRTPKQKLEAMLQALSTVGQAMILLAITATLWHVGSAVVHVFEIVLWPFVLPLKILRWLGGGGG